MLKMILIIILMTCLKLNIWVFDNILADAKSCHKKFVYDIPYKT